MANKILTFLFVCVICWAFMDYLIDIITGFARRNWVHAYYLVVDAREKDGGKLHRMPVQMTTTNTLKAEDFPRITDNIKADTGYEHVMILSVSYLGKQKAPVEEAPNGR